MYTRRLLQNKTSGDVLDIDECPNEGLDARILGSEEEEKRLEEPLSPNFETFEFESRRIPTSSSCKPWRFWLKATNSFHQLFEAMFFRLGLFVATHPWKVILLAMIWVASVSWGFIYMKMETRTEKLFIPQQSRALTDISIVEPYFTVRVRVAEVIITSTRSDSILTDDAFRAGLHLHTAIMTTTGFQTVCIPKRGKSRVNMTTHRDCSVLSPFELFHFNQSGTVNVRQRLNDVYQDGLLVMSNNVSPRVNFQSFFGNMMFDASGQIVKAGALRFFYSVVFPLDDAATDVIEKWEDEFIDLLQREKNELRKKGFNLYYFTTKSIDESAKSSTMSDSKFISLAFSLMCAFTVLSFVKPWKRFLSHGVLAQCGLAAVAFGIGSSFGLMMLLGVPFVSIVGVLPFVILGVAIDDMFIIIDFLDRTDFTLPTNLRIANTMKRCGGSITMTTMTDLVAFAVSTMTEFPAVRYFCQYAFAGLLLSYLMIITFFVACMALDVNRAKNNRLDVLCCFKYPKFKELPSTKQWTIANKIMHACAKILMTRLGKITVIIAAIGLLTSGVISALNVSEHFDLKMLGKDGSYFKQFLITKERYFDDPHLVTVMISGDVDLSLSTNQNEAFRIERIATNNKYYKPFCDNWLRDFRRWTNSTGNSTSASEKEFLARVRQFLTTPLGQRHRSNIVWNTNGTSMEASRIIVFVKDHLTSSEAKTAMVTFREDLDRKISFKTYAVTMFFMYYEQYVRILPETMRNLGMCAGVILIMAAPYVVHPGILLLLFLSFSALIIELVGLMVVWGVSLNSISMIIIIMALGFSVDYSAHVAHAYVVSPAETPEARMIDALSTVGASVFLGGFSTFLGMITTGFASSEVFRIFFKMLFGIVVIGLLNGLIILPVMLTVFCRTKVINAQPSSNVTSPTSKLSPAVSSAGSGKRPLGNGVFM